MKTMKSVSSVVLQKLLVYLIVAFLIQNSLFFNCNYRNQCSASGISNARLWREMGGEESAEVQFNYDYIPTHHVHRGKGRHQGHHHRKPHMKPDTDEDSKADDINSVGKGVNAGVNKKSNDPFDLTVVTAKPIDPIGSRYAYVYIQTPSDNTARHKQPQHKQATHHYNRNKHDDEQPDAEELRRRAEVSAEEESSRRNGDAGRPYYPRQLEREVPGTAIQSYFVCEFEDNDCGLKNDVQMKTLFEMRSRRDKPIFGYTNMLAIDIAAARSAGARLVTMYFPTNGYNFGCFTMDYFFQGTGAKKMTIYQQDKDNSCIWEDERPDLGPHGRWRTTTIKINLSRGDPRLFIEAHFDNRVVDDPGYIAIKKVAFSYGSCIRDDANYCQKRQSPADQPQGDEPMLGDEPSREDTDADNFGTEDKVLSPDNFEVEVFDVNKHNRRNKYPHDRERRRQIHT